MAGANRAIEAAVGEIRREQASKAAVQKAGTIVDTEMAAVKRELAATRTQPPPRDEVTTLKHVAVGDPVRWKRGGKDGVVLAPPEADRVLVGIGGLKVHIPLQELLPRAKSADIGKKAAPPVRKPLVNAQTRIDVRGMRVEEALEAVDKFLDNATVAGLAEVKVIHGVGTGALRNNLMPYLDKHPLVQTISHGPRNHENPGMTIVRMADSRG